MGIKKDPKKEVRQYHFLDHMLLGYSVYIFPYPLVNVHITN